MKNISTLIIQENCYVHEILDKLRVIYDDVTMIPGTDCFIIKDYMAPNKYGISGFIDTKTGEMTDTDYVIEHIEYALQHLLFIHRYSEELKSDEVYMRIYDMHNHKDILNNTVIHNLSVLRDGSGFKIFKRVGEVELEVVYNT